jgi:hypothetical protein
MRADMDGVLFENLTDKAFSEKDKVWVREQLLDLQGSQVYALDYTTRFDEREAEMLRRAHPTMHYYRAPDESLQSLS